MRALYAKESWELRFAPLIAVVAVIALTVGAVALNRQVPISTGELEGIGVVVTLLSSLIIGSGSIASEVGGGTLQFLSTLPISRRSIWLIKLAGGLGAAFVAALAAAATCALLDAVFAHWPHYNLLDGDLLTTSQWYAATGCVILAFLVGFAVSAFFDRSIASAVAGVLVFLAFGAAVSSIAAIWRMHVDQVDVTAIGLSVFVTIVLACGAFRAFTRGETLQTRKKYVEAIIGGGIAALAIVVTLVIGYWLFTL